MVPSRAVDVFLVSKSCHSSNAQHRLCLGSERTFQHSDSDIYPPSLGRLTATKSPGHRRPVPAGWRFVADARSGCGRCALIDKALPRQGWVACPRACNSLSPRGHERAQRSHWNALKSRNNVPGQPHLNGYSPNNTTCENARFSFACLGWPFPNLTGHLPTPAKPSVKPVPNRDIAIPAMRFDLAISDMTRSPLPGMAL